MDSNDQSRMMRGLWADPNSVYNRRKRKRMNLICVGCGKQPHELSEYVEAAQAQPDRFKDAADYAWREEGTLNHENGHFLCTTCYIKAGMPSNPTTGWHAP